MTAVLVIALAVALAVAVWLDRERRRLRALLRVAPLCYLACHAPTGGDVFLCPACAVTINWATGREPTPLYDEAFGGISREVPIDCNNCDRPIVPPAEVGE